MNYRKIPLLVPEAGKFSNENMFVLHQFIGEAKTDFKIIKLSSIRASIVMIVKHSNKKLLAFENWPTLGSKNGVFR